MPDHPDTHVWIRDTQLAPEVATVGIKAAADACFIVKDFEFAVVGDLVAMSGERMDHSLHECASLQRDGRNQRLNDDLEPACLAEHL